LTNRQQTDTGENKIAFSAIMTIKYDTPQQAATNTCDISMQQLYLSDV